MKLSVFTVATPEMSPEELAAAAKKHGIDGIEWRYKEPSPETAGQTPSFWGNNRCTIIPSGGQEELNRIKLASETHGVKTISVTPYLQVGDIEGTEEVLRAAKFLGAAFIRLGVPYYDGIQPYPQLFETARRYLKESESLCKSYGIKGLIETHHVTIAASASAAYRLCEGLDPDYVGVLYDPGNMVYEGFENYRLGMELLGPYLAHVHVKNAGWKQLGQNEDGSMEWKCDWKGIKQGAVPWRRVIEDLRHVGYTGYLGVEDFSREFDDSDLMLQHYAAYMKELLQS